MQHSFFCCSPGTGGLPPELALRTRALIQEEHRFFGNWGYFSVSSRADKRKQLGYDKMIQTSSTLLHIHITHGYNGYIRYEFWVKRIYENTPFRMHRRSRIHCISFGILCGAKPYAQMRLNVLLPRMICVDRENALASTRAKFA